MTNLEILDTLRKLNKEQPFMTYRFGLAGSYANGTQDADSDIDIVITTGNLTFDQIDHIKECFHDCDVDVLQLDLLKEEDEELDEFSTEMGLPINEDSVYKSIMKEVIWA